MPESTIVPVSASSNTQFFLRVEEELPKIYEQFYKIYCNEINVENNKEWIESTQLHQLLYFAEKGFETIRDMVEHKTSKTTYDKNNKFWNAFKKFFIENQDSEDNIQQYIIPYLEIFNAEFQTLDPNDKRNKKARNKLITEAKTDFLSLIIPYLCFRLLFDINKIKNSNTGNTH